MSIQYTALGFEPTTTRPGLPIEEGKTKFNLN